MARRPKIRRTFWLLAVLIFICGAGLGYYYRDGLPALMATQGPASLYQSGVMGPAKLTISVIDVGQGDAILLETPDQRALLVDGGDNARGIDMGSARVLPYLSDRGVTRLDWAVATHPHSDHIGGLISVVRRTTITNFGDNGVVHPTADVRNLLLAVKGSHAKYVQLRRGDTLALGPQVHCAVLWPNGSREENLNNTSVVLQVTAGAFGMVLPGDLEAEGQAQLMAQGGPQPAQVMKAPHHGSSGALNHDFWERVHPTAVLISCGAGNSYGHPHQQALDYYNQIGAKVFRTDQQGTLAVQSDGRNWSIEGRANGPALLSSLVKRVRKMVH